MIRIGDLQVDFAQREVQQKGTLLRVMLSSLSGQRRFPNQYWGLDLP